MAFIRADTQIYAFTLCLLLKEAVAFCLPLLVMGAFFKHLNNFKPLLGISCVQTHTHLDHYYYIVFTYVSLATLLQYSIFLGDTVSLTPLCTILCHVKVHVGPVGAVTIVLLGSHGVTSVDRRDLAPPTILNYLATCSHQDHDCLLHTHTHKDSCRDTTDLPVVFPCLLVFTICLYYCTICCCNKYCHFF